jgi:hypothetical protein
MKWRTLLAVLLGCLLPVPLLWALSWLLLGGWRASETREADGRVVPILAPDETRRLLTFHRSCQGNEDCDAPLVCLRGQLMFDHACVASDCATDRDCREGFACRSMPAGDRVVRMCAAMGTAQEDELCMKLPINETIACAPGLVCAHLRCRRSCQFQEPQGCPEGYFCSDSDVEGLACLPTCEGRACPEGQRCVGLKHGSSVCARVHGPDCQLNPCPEQQVCDVSFGTSRGDVWMRCSLSCDKRGPPCPKGFSCLGASCVRRCTADEPGACGPREKCVGASEDSLGICILDKEEK